MCFWPKCIYSAVRYLGCFAHCAQCVFGRLRAMCFGDFCCIECAYGAIYAKSVVGAAAVVAAVCAGKQKSCCAVCVCVCCCCLNSAVVAVAAVGCTGAAQQRAKSQGPQRHPALTPRKHIASWKLHIYRISLYDPTGHESPLGQYTHPRMILATCIITLLDQWRSRQNLTQK